MNPVYQLKIWRRYTIFSPVEGNKDQTKWRARQILHIMGKQTKKWVATKGGPLPSSGLPVQLRTTENKSCPHRKKKKEKHDGGYLLFCPGVNGNMGGKAKKNGSPFKGGNGNSGYTGDFGKGGRPLPFLNLKWITGGRKKMGLRVSMRNTLMAYGLFLKEEKGEGKGRQQMTGRSKRGGKVSEK